MAFKHFWVQYKLGNDSDQAYIKSNSFVIGRAPNCDVPIPTDILSRRHLRVTLEDDVILLEDLGSTNGTFLQGEQLVPNVQYEYKTGNRLYLDADKKCTLRITAIYQRDIVDPEMEQREVDLEKKRSQLKNKKTNVYPEITSAESNENFLAAASESVDNVVENLVFLAKNARFNREKKIREAESISQELLEKAKKEIETNRALLTKELKTFQEKTKKEAKRILEKANNQAEEHMTKAEVKAQQILEKTNKIVEQRKQEIEKERQDILDKAQEKYSHIISDAYLKNEDLKKENVALNEKNQSSLQVIQTLKAQIQDIEIQRDQKRTALKDVQEYFKEESQRLDTLRDEVARLEKLQKEALLVLEVRVPNLEKKAMDLESKISESEESLQLKEEEIVKTEKLLKDTQFLIETNQKKVTQSENRLDELSSKIIEAEDNLFKLTKIKQQRNEEMDRELQARRDKQKASEQRALEKIAKKKEKTEKEIEINLENAKKHAVQLIEAAKKECELLREQAHADGIALKRDSEAYSKELREQADTYSHKVTSEADEYEARIKAEVDAEIRDRRQNFEDEVESEKSRLVAEARQEAERLHKTSHEKAEQLIQQAKEQYHSAIQKAEADIKQKWKQTEDEVQQYRREIEQELHELRTHAVQKMEEQRQLTEAEEKEKSRFQALRMKKELNEVLRARITPYLKEEQQVSKVAEIFSRSIDSVLTGEVYEESFDAENYSDIDPSLEQVKVKKFWVGSGVAAAVLTLLFVFSGQLKEYATDSGRSLAENQEKIDEAQMARVKQVNDLSAAFNPIMKKEYLNSYTERMMYTEQYLYLENDPGFREQWRVELEDFFVDQLRLNENDMVPFFAREAALIKELTEARSKINGNFVEEGKKRLEEIEADFYRRVKQNGLKQDQINKINTFKKKFFEANKELFGG
jgi:pSer/pThr/pTyr-binding forkhead associated (FHA) protein